MTERGAPRVKWNPRPEVCEAISAWVVQPIHAFANLPKVVLTQAQVAQLRRSGTAPVVSGLPDRGARFVYVALNEFIAIAEVGPSGPKVVRLL